ncbi:MAG: DeoR family transcriptional regulator [Pseudomonadota bacterium]|jgi:DeoR family glycerol-3-phosphate regulon repressor
MSVSTRRARIVSLLRESGYAPIETLSTYFSVTPQTIRADLNALADEGLLVRHHGGAAAPSSISNTDYAARRHEFAREKARIAQAVAEELTDRSSVFLTPGTTMLAVAEALRVRRELKVITHSLEAAQILLSEPDFEVVVLGGRLERRNLATSDSTTLQTLSQYRADVCVCSAGGVDNQGNLLEYHEGEAAIVRGMFNNSRRAILALDHSKFRRTAAVRVAGLDAISMLVTDKQPPPLLRSRLRSAKVAVKIAR